MKTIAKRRMKKKASSPSVDIKEIERALSPDAKTAVEAMERVSRFRLNAKPYILPSFSYVRCG
jgi:hypothetical protein